MSLDCSEAIMDVLKDLADSAQQASITLEDFVHRVELRHGQTGADCHEQTSALLRDEMLAQRINLKDQDGVQMIALTTAGHIHYSRMAQAAVRAPSTTARRSHESKSEARSDYLRSASILSGVMEALRGHEPDVLLKDARRLPELVRSNLESVSHLQNINADLADRIDQTVDRIEHLERQGAGEQA